MFVKLLFISLVILSIAFILITTFVSSIFSRQFIDIKFNELQNEAEVINYCLNISTQSSDHNILTSIVISAAGRNNAEVWLVDNDGNITEIANKNSVETVNSKVDGEAADIFESVKSGETIKRIGSFGSRTKSTVMTYGTKLTINGEDAGVLFINADLFDLQTYLNSITGQVILSAIVSLAVAIILIYCMAQYFTKPIVLMNKGAKKFAKGNFDVYIDINQNDEVGQLADSFNMMAKELKNLDDNRKRFISDVSHELRAPLAAIQGYIQGMNDGMIEEKDYHKYMDIVLSETHRLNNLINDILDLSQIDSGTYPFHAKTFDIIPLVKKIAKIFEGAASAKSIEIVVEELEEKLLVLGDEDRIAQVISNFLDNAIKYSEDNGIVRILVFKKDNIAYVEVKDKGKGLSEADCENIWQPFFQVDKARTPGNIRGTGLGLFIAKSILEQHEGEIGVLSTLGQGSTLYFTLPCGNENIEDED